MMLVASGIAAANSYAFMPVTRQGDETLNIWLQASQTIPNAALQQSLLFMQIAVALCIMLPLILTSFRVYEVELCRAFPLCNTVC